LRDEQGNAVDIESGDEDDENVDADRTEETMDDMDHAHLMRDRRFSPSPGHS
jgi:hypothetical protein